MEDQPTPTEEEQQSSPEEITEQEDMRGPGPPDPELPGRDEDDDG
jgi:hypothetical protein